MVTPTIKYGGGDGRIRLLLGKSSAIIGRLEEKELEFLSSVYDFPAYQTRSEIDLQRAVEGETQINNVKTLVFNITQEIVTIVEEGVRHDLFN